MRIGKKLFQSRVQKEKLQNVQENGIQQNNKDKQVITLDDIIGSTTVTKEAEERNTTDTDMTTPLGMREIHYEDISQKQVNYIENPLPVPKRRAHKQMEYAIDTIPENDDFDLQDMTGINFFDIE